MKTSLHTAIKNSVGSNHNALGAKASFCGKKFYLSYSEDKGWKVLRLNIFQRFARNGLGAYESTHLGNVLPQLNKSKSCPAKLLERLTTLWTKTYPHAKPPTAHKPAPAQKKPTFLQKHLGLNQKNVQLFGHEQPLSKLANYCDSETVRMGLFKLGQDYTYRRIAGDGHCLFRSIAAGIAVGLDQGDEAVFTLLKERIETSLDRVNASDKLREHYQTMVEDLSQLFDADKISVSELMRDPGVSNNMVQFLRLIACEQNAVNKEDLEDFFTGDLNAYLNNMKKMTPPVAGGHMEIQAIVDCLGLEVTILDADGIGKGGSVDENHYKHDGQETSLGLHLLYLPGHYNLALVA